MTQRHPAQPLVSVIVVNWNGRDLLNSCFEALEQQTWRNMEFILVDNGSTDNSPALLREVLPRYPGCRSVRVEKNQGYGANQKSCYRKALDLGGDIIVMLHPDYQYTPALINSASIKRRSA